MILALDTDVIVGWMAPESPGHDRASSLVSRHLRQSGGASLGLTEQVLHEFLHIVTDSRRFERPVEMARAVTLARQLWDSRDAVRIRPGPGTFHRTLELLERHRLGRKRILDTAFAATLESAGVKSLATFNGRDFALFEFLEVVEP